ncbi:MspA family porin [Rhodococcus oxybenzonivorans]|uniref:MspA family porin n=1 Tax=Rhodococcus oxybenzonivorans TaxID=1990687 RepID=UPI0013A53D46|nr:MspA family porin [Rhodococcus oxybenzonivorans]
MSVAVRMLRRLSIGSMVAVGAVVLAAGAGSAAPNPVPDAFETTTTGDGWVLNIRKTGEIVNQVPNLAASQFSREGFVSYRTEADITGDGDAPVNGASLEIGYQVGCGIDVSSGLAVGLGLSVGSSIGISATGPKADLGAQVQPNVSTTLKPGTITDVPFKTKELANGKAGVSVKNVHLKIDGCMGPVAIRSYVTFSTTSDSFDDTVAAYGPVMWL